MEALIIHGIIIVAIVIGHALWLNFCCVYDSSGPYDPEQLPKLQKKMKHGLWVVWFLIAASTISFFIFK